MLWNKVLLIYDGTENGIRAAEYAAKMFAQTTGIQITILGVHEKIPRHDLKDTSPVMEKLERQIASMQIQIEKGRTGIQEAKALIVKTGLAEDLVNVRFEERKESAAQHVIEAVNQGGFGTIIIGRGESDDQMLAGGNIVDDLLDEIKDRAVCVV